MDNVTIKGNIRRIRRAQKITQESMAMRLGISLTAYRDLEKGNTAILNGHLIRIADILDIPTEEIVLGYKPSQMVASSLEEMQEEYSGRVNNLERRIKDLEKLVDSYEETIQSKNEIILMLKKKLDEEK